MCHSYVYDNQLMNKSCMKVLCMTYVSYIFNKVICYAYFECGVTTKRKLGIWEMEPGWKKSDRAGLKWRVCIVCHCYKHFCHCLTPVWFLILLHVQIFPKTQQAFHERNWPCFHIRHKLDWITEICLGSLWGWLDHNGLRAEILWVCPKPKSKAGVFS